MRIVSIVFTTALVRSEINHHILVDSQNLALYSKMLNQIRRSALIHNFFSSKKTGVYKANCVRNSGKKFLKVVIVILEKDRVMRVLWLAQSASLRVHS